MINIFRYREVNKNLIYSLVTSTIYFPPRYKLNDPFDCTIDVKKVLQKLKNSTNADVVESLLEKEFSDSKLNGSLDKIGICSFSTTEKENVMWSHYADEHKGVCLQYQFPEPFFEGINGFIGIAPVIYKDSPVTKWLNENLNLYTTDHYKFITGFIFTMLTSKAPSWDYEHEIRAIKTEVGPVNIPNQFLKKVIFGLRTEELDEELIRNIIENDNLYNVEYSKVVKTDDDFNVEIIDY